MKTFVPVCLLALLAVAAPAVAEDPAPNTVALPDVGLSLDVPAGWALEQYGAAVLKLTKQGAMVWIYHREETRKDAAAPLRQMATRVAGEQPDGAEPEIRPCPVKGATEAALIRYVEADNLRVFAVVEREGDGGFDIEMMIPKDAVETLGEEAEGLARTIDVRRFEHDDRLVDWTLGFTIDGVAGWRQEQDEDGVRITAADAPACALRVVSAPRSASLIAQMDRVIQVALGRLQKAGFTVAPRADAETGATMAQFKLERVHGDALDAVRTTVDLEKGEAKAEIRIEAAVDGELAVLWVGRDDASMDRGRGRAQTFRARADPGPRLDGVAETVDRFPDEKKGPALRFTLPKGFSVAKATQRMRLATFSAAPGVDGAAYWFGGGQGGTLEANLSRWKGQWQGPEAVITTHEGAGVKATVLHFTGTFTGRRGGDDTEKRGLFAYIDVAGGPVTLKLVGPTSVVTESIAKAFDTWVASFRLK